MSEDLSDATKHTTAVDTALSVTIDTLNEEQRKLLSKALFPDTHTDEVEVCGKMRKLRPLPIKWSKQVHALLEPLNEGVTSLGVQAGNVDLAEVEKQFESDELDLLRLLLSVATILAKFYGWEDVEKKLEEEDVYQEELQALAVRQLNLQRTNDFLLMGLRVLVGVMQQAEIQALRLLSMFSGQS